LATKSIGGAFDGPPTWKPEPGDSVQGLVTRKEMVSTQYGEKPLLEVDDTDGAVAIFCGTAILKRVFSDVNIGDRLDLVYEGERVAEKSGRTFKSYTGSIESFDGETV
jgi:hypothetical protein